LAGNPAPRRPLSKGEAPAGPVDAEAPAPPLSEARAADEAAQPAQAPPDAPGPAEPSRPKSSPELPLSGQPSSRLEDALLQYLELRIDEMRQSAADRVKSGERDKLKTQTGQMFTRVAVLTLYGLVLGLAFQPLLVGALLDPKTVGSRVQSARTSLTVISFVPPEYRATVIALLTALVLFIFRSTPLGVRHTAGGVLSAGAVALTLLGLSAAATSGGLGIAAALVGLVAAVVILFEVMRMLLRLAQVDGGRPALAESLDARAVQTLGGSINAIGNRLQVLDSLPALVVFLAVPVLCVLAIGSAAVLDARDGPLYWASWAAQHGVFLAWCFWAFAVTPAPIRVPLWSLLVWGYLFIGLFAWSAVSGLYAVALLATVLINVVLLVIPVSRNSVAA
jgi:hypothetical protein